MLREAIEAELRAEHERDGYLFPDYGGYCIGNVPDTVRSVFDVDARRPLPGDVLGELGDGAARLVLVVVDGYGLDAWRRDYADHRFLRALTETGRVTPLTSIYPSETAAAITTLETGQLPVEHGRIGWNVYDPATDRSFVALDGEVKVDPAGGPEFTDEAFDGIGSLYRPLADAGIDCHRLQPFESVTPGAVQHWYDGLDTFGTRLAEVVRRTDPPAYVYGYIPDVDHVAHEDGTEAPAYQATVRAVCDQLEAFVAGLEARVASETLLVVMADHGHVNTEPERNIDLAGNAAVMTNLRRHDDGTPVRLAGSPRNVHLHLQDGGVPAIRNALADLDARLFSRAETLRMDLFGDRSATDRFRRRCGDLVLTHRELGVWFGDVEPDNLALVGLHGGLHPTEMLVPFAAVRADALVRG